jgi:anti-sigma B factor antagonist
VTLGGHHRPTELSALVVSFVLLLRGMSQATTFFAIGTNRSRALKCARTDDAHESNVVVEGALDAVTAREIQLVFDSLAADSPRRVRIDLANVTLLDSSGVGAIVSLYKRLKARGGRLAVAGARGQPLAVLKLLKLERVLGVAE